MRTITLVIAAGFVMAPALACAQADPADGFTVRPAVLDSDNDNGATVGLDYTFKQTVPLVDFDKDGGGGGLGTQGLTLGSAALSLEGQGTVTASTDRNPRNLVDAKATLKAHFGSVAFGSFEAGGFVKVEADQTFDNVQSVFGGRATYAKVGILPGKKDVFALDLHYGRVDPSDDELRKAALGVTHLDSYDRLEFEALYIYPVGGKVIDTIEFNYRRFQEIDAAPAIRAAKLRVHELGTVRVGLQGDFFIAYSAGKLPFDAKNDQTIAIGLSYKLF